jgi:hypothetical protein
MLRASPTLRVSATPVLLFGQNHLKPSAPKYSDKPGMWGPNSGPNKDTLSRRWEFGKFVSMKKIGQLTAPLKSKENVWRFRVFQARLWKGTVIFLVSLSVILMGNVWCLLAYHAYSVGPSTPVLERKVKEHRISKQIMSMVREHERELTVEKELADATKNLNESPAAKATA